MGPMTGLTILILSFVVRSDVIGSSAERTQLNKGNPSGVEPMLLVHNKSIM